MDGVEESEGALVGVAETPDWTPWGAPRMGERGVETAFHHASILVRALGDDSFRVVSPGDVFAGDGGALEWSPMPWAHRGKRLWRSPGAPGPGAVFRGRDDRLFLGSDGVGEQLFEGAGLGIRGLNGWTEALKRRVDLLTARDIVYRHLVVPDGHAICADAIDGAPKLSPDRPFLQVRARADERVRASFVYPLEELIAGRADAEVAHPHDVHLTGWGYFLCYRALMAALPGIDPARLLREEELHRRKGFIAGDVARSVGAPGRRVDLHEPPVPPHDAIIKGASYKPNQVDVFETRERGLPKLVMFRTSNTSHFFPHLFRHFSRIVAVASHDLFVDVLDSERPDVVIGEMPERYFAHGAHGESETDWAIVPRDPENQFELRTGHRLPLPRGEG